MNQHAKRSFRIGPATVGEGGPVYVIAEAGVNHDGCVDTAMRLIDIAFEAGADAVKFQVFSADRLVTRSAPTAEYQKQAAFTTSQYEMLKHLELSHDDFAAVAGHAGRYGIEFLATPFGVEDMSFLVSIGVRAIKLASTDIVNGPLLEAAAATGLPVIASTGAADRDEVAMAVRRFAIDQSRDREGADMLGRPLPYGRGSVVHTPGSDKCGSDVQIPGPLALMHCVSSYPTPESDANLGAIRTLAETFDCVSGYSDHTESVEMGGLAVAAGARIIEKHFTLDRGRKGPDHAFSLEPAQLAEYIRRIRRVEGTMGDGEIAAAPCERDVRDKARGQVVAARDIRAGETLTAATLTIKRAGGGIPAGELPALIGRTVRDHIAGDTPLTWEAIARSADARHTEA